MPKGKKGGGKKGKGKDKAADVPKEKHEITLMKEKVRPSEYLADLTWSPLPAPISIHQFEQEAMPHWVILHMNVSDACSF